MKEHAIQFSFPDMDMNRQVPNWLRQFAQFLTRHANWFRYGGWIVLAALVLVALYFLVQFLRHRDLSPAVPAPKTGFATWQPSAERARLLLADADAQAQQGRFDEAAHLLLLVCIQEIGERRPGLVLPALTSREIGNLEELSPRARDVFSQIARIVEHCVFGARPLDARDFGQCRQAFEQFTIPDAWDIAA